MNWVEHAVVLVQSDYQDCVNKLEQDQELKGIDGVVFITAAGQDFGFLSEHGKSVDW
jgi:2-keto-3-deoxy-L-rhamnonate aldolase RhmA